MAANAERAPLLAKRPANRPQLSSFSHLSGGVSYSAVNRSNPSRRKPARRDKSHEDSLSDGEKRRILVVIGIMRFTEPIRCVLAKPPIKAVEQRSDTSSAVCSSSFVGCLHCDLLHLSDLAGTAFVNQVCLPWLLI